MDLGFILRGQINPFCLIYMFFKIYFNEKLHDSWFLKVLEYITFRNADTNNRRTFKSVMSASLQPIVNIQFGFGQHFKYNLSIYL